MISETDWLGDVTAYTKPLGGRPAKGHTGRQRKLYCERCGFIAYASRGALERCGFPSCACGEPMALANLRDRALVEWEQLERELMAYGRDAYNAAMRELGHTGMVETHRNSCQDKRRSSLTTRLRSKAPRDWTASAVLSLSKHCRVVSGGNTATHGLF